MLFADRGTCGLFMIGICLVLMTMWYIIATRVRVTKMNQDQTPRARHRLGLQSPYRDQRAQSQLQEVSHREEDLRRWASWLVHHRPQHLGQVKEGVADPLFEGQRARSMRTTQCQMYHLLLLPKRRPVGRDVQAGKKCLLMNPKMMRNRR